MAIDAGSSFVSESYFGQTPSPFFRGQNSLLKTTIPNVIHDNKRPLKLLAQPRMPVVTDHLMRCGCLPVATVTVKQIQQ